MLKWYKEFKLMRINTFEKEYNQKIDQLEKKLLNLIEVKNVRSKNIISICKVN